MTDKPELNAIQEQVNVRSRMKAQEEWNEHYNSFRAFFYHCGFTDDALVQFFDRHQTPTSLIDELHRLFIEQRTATLANTLAQEIVYSIKFPKDKTKETKSSNE